MNESFAPRPGTAEKAGDKLVDGMGGVRTGGSFFGRQRELEILGRALSEVRMRSPRLVLVTGERGVGRTSLLRQFLAGAHDVCRITASGDESESFLSYGVLEQLARSSDPPLPFELPALTRPSAPRHDPVAMGTAVLDMLLTLEKRAAVVLVVDDADVADEPSLLALLFALRRLRGARVLAVLSVREDHSLSLPEGLGRLFASEAGTTVRLGGYDDWHFRQIISTFGVGVLSRAVSTRLREHSRGNPGYARALVEQAGIDALRRWGELPWPAPKSLARVVLDRLAACPPAARQLVAAAAVAGDRCQLAVLQQLSRIEQPLAALQAAIDNGLVDYDNREVAFASGLVRGAVYHGLGLLERAELHMRAAALVDDEGAALRHRAAATAGVDEDLASAMAAFARQEGARGAWASAAALFEEAAMLFTAGRERERTVLAAIDSHLLAGDVIAAMSLGQAIESYADVAWSHYLLGRFAAIDGRDDDTRRLLARALEACDDETDRALVCKIAVELAGLNAHLLRPTDAIKWAERAIDIAQGTSVGQGSLPYLAFGLVATGQADRAVGLACSPRVSEHGSDHELASQLTAGTVALLYAGALDRARDHAVHLVSVASRSTLLGAHVKGLALLAFTEYRLGSWTDAIEHVELALSIVEGAGLTSSRSFVHATAAWARAGRGEWGTAEAHVREAESAARYPSDIALARMADAVVGRARGEHRRVIDAVTELRTLGAPHALDEPGGLWPWHEVYVDALIALGLLADARKEVARIAEVAVARGARSVILTTLRLRASIESAQGRSKDADELFREAIRQLGGIPEPFNHALVHAAYGSFLRRSGQRSAAATQLDMARGLFARLGATPFVEQCDRELASARPPVGRPRSELSSELTPREASVAQLVCEGKRNREVANELVVSENTVEYHLKHIYAKLGVASRSQLIVRLGAGREQIGRIGRGGFHARSRATES